MNINKHMDYKQIYSTTNNSWTNDFTSFGYNVPEHYGVPNGYKKTI